MSSSGALYHTCRVCVYVYVSSGAPAVPGAGSHQMGCLDPGYSEEGTFGSERACAVLRAQACRGRLCVALLAKTRRTLPNTPLNPSSDRKSPIPPGGCEILKTKTSTTSQKPPLPARPLPSALCAHARMRTRTVHISRLTGTSEDCWALRAIPKSPSLRVLSLKMRRLLGFKSRCITLRVSGLGSGLIKTRLMSRCGLTCAPC
jgi:hypothetical protein